jgi:hypothetical protein
MRRLVVVVTTLAASCDRTSDSPDPRRGGNEPRSLSPDPAPGPTAPTPPAADTHCADPVAGLWVARRYDESWYEHRITLGRGGTTCRQESRSWPGSAGDLRPPRCADGALAFHQVILDCDATLAAPMLSVRSRTITTNVDTCGGEASGYNLDFFDGALRGNTWDTHNNDGDVDVDMPYRFHRLSCEP